MRNNTLLKPLPEGTCATYYTAFWENGYTVFALYGINEDGTCDCGNASCEAVGKHPFTSQWQYTRHYSPEQLQEMEQDGLFDSGYGILIQDGLLIIDVDARNGGVESYAKLVSEIPEIAGCGLIVNTGSGGGSKHLFFKYSNTSQALSSKLDDYPGIDFKHSGFVVGAGSMHKSGNKYEILIGSPADIGEAPAGLIELLLREDIVAIDSGNYSSFSDIQGVLDSLDPNCRYDDWLKIGMGLHHEFKGSQAGFELWNSWSSKAIRKGSDGKTIYPGIDELKKKWGSFNFDSLKPVTIATVFDMAQRARTPCPIPWEKSDIIIATKPATFEVDAATLIWLKDQILSREMKSSGITPPAEFIRDDRVHHYDDDYGYWYQFNGEAVSFGNHEGGHLYPDDDKVLAKMAGLIPFPILTDEWNNATLAPKCIVDNYIFADVRLLIGSGGVGKTTLALFEVVHIALGLKLYDNEIKTPGNVIIVTAEDQRGRLIARLREVTGAIVNGDQNMIRRVMKCVHILDVTSKPKRLTKIENDVVVIDDAIVDGIVTSFKSVNPSLVIFDPAVSFGVGEARVNDAEQGLITAARRLVKDLDCCVTFIHHTGKAFATNSESTKDEIFKNVQNQYGFRGGSALADGARMVHILGTPTFDEFKKHTEGKINPSTYFEYRAMSPMFLGLAKMTYVKPRQPVIALSRDGYQFHHHALKGQLTPEDIKGRILEYLSHEVKKGHQHSIRSLEEDIHRNHVLNCPHKDIEGMIKDLISDGKIEEVPLEKAQGAKKTFLKVAQKT